MSVTINFGWGTLWSCVQGFLMGYGAWFVWVDLSNWWKARRANHE